MIEKSEERPGSPFLLVPEADWVAGNGLAFAIRDKFPVAPGHTLVIPRRLVVTWWDAAADERNALFELVDEVKRQLDLSHRPDGYNVGFNAGPAAGQTVDHLHVHVIPRYAGDMEDPRGGVRHVIPSRGNYLTPSTADTPGVDLVDSQERRLRLELLRRLRAPEFDRIDFVVSFVMRSGLDLLARALGDALERGATIRILTSDYLRITDADALARLFDLATGGTAGTLTTRIFHDDSTSFHPKAYLFWSSDGDLAVGFVGSNNLSKSGIDGGVEWAMGTEQVAPLRRAFDRLWDDPRARPLTADWLQTYRSHRREPGEVVPIGVEIEAPVQPATPRPVQKEALRALEQTRLDGHRAGLVVMATGLGKTWVAAFDSARPQFRRVLFVAHREEILRQSRDAFRQVQPDGDFGLYFGGEKQPDARVVFASIATLANRFEEFPPDAFDYIVVDEFHHAAAPTYRRVIEHFTPAFLLGLTATPDRLDGADLLALCGDNLVFERTLVDGITSGDLCPFTYYGIADVTDFAPIPWRNGRFEPDALAEAVETKARARQTYDEWAQRRGSRTLAFCASTTHADVMTRFFAERGVRAAAVHSGPSTAPRGAAIEQLRAGELDIIFTVDVFNEGLDVPAIDTVLLLRPTASPVVFLQQLGRGLRNDGSGKQLTVVDLIGNHHSFLARPRALLELGGRSVSTKELLDRMRSGDFDLPAGCSVHYDVEVVDLLRQLVRLGRTDLVADFCRRYHEEHGRRPTAIQAYRAGVNPEQPRRTHGGWFRFLAGLDLLDDAERRVVERSGDTLLAIEAEPISKSYKLVTFQALLRDGLLRRGGDVTSITTTAQRLVAGDPRLLADAANKELGDPASASVEQFARFWRKFPLDHLAGQGSGASRENPLFHFDGDRFVPTFHVSVDGEIFDALVAELVDYRLARYLLTRAATATPTTARIKVSHTGGRPILRFDRQRSPQLPDGEVTFTADGARFSGRFVKIALNVAQEVDGQRDLAELLRGWFGPNAGLPGTHHTVELDLVDGTWVMRPLTADAAPALEAGNTA